ncbi:MAG: type III polyketide synthase [Ferruginibacter sp.]
MSKIVSIATGVPRYKHLQENISSFAETIYCEDEIAVRKMKFLYRHSGISTRYSVIPDYSPSEAGGSFYEKTADLEPFPNLEKRMECYIENAANLSIDTINKCIGGKIDSSDITHLITVSCTGLSAPGLDLEIMETMGLRRNLSRSSVNFMGCYAGVHALKMADAICHNDIGANVVIVCTELCTLHFQKENSIDNITSTLLFADGCAAVLVQHKDTKNKGFTLRNFYSEVEFKGRKDMSWALSSKGFLMTLSGYVPELVKKDFNPLVENALQHASLNKEDITHWCIHPGGKKILEAIEHSTGLSKAHLQYSYDILNDYGNMSSPTLLFVLEKILREFQQQPPEKTATVFSAAFGPGLTMETFIATYD